MNIEKIMNTGYFQQSKKRKEFYDKILNDIAEGIEIKGRLTGENLIEVIGYQQQQNQALVDAYNELHGEVLRSATRGLATRLGAREVITKRK